MSARICCTAWTRAATEPSSFCASAESCDARRPTSVWPLGGADEVDEDDADEAGEYVVAGAGFGAWAIRVVDDEDADANCVSLEGPALFDAAGLAEVSPLLELFGLGPVSDGHRASLT